MLLKCSHGLSCFFFLYDYFFFTPVAVIEKNAWSKTTMVRINVARLLLAIFFQKKTSSEGLRWHILFYFLKNVGDEFHQSPQTNLAVKAAGEYAVNEDIKLVCAQLDKQQIEYLYTT